MERLCGVIIVGYTRTVGRTFPTIVPAVAWPGLGRTSSLVGSTIVTLGEMSRTTLKVRTTELGDGPRDRAPHCSCAAESGSWLMGSTNLAHETQ